MINKLAQVALLEVGVKEEGGNNNGARIREYQAATDLAPASWPWCAAFVDWCVREWLKDDENLKWLALKTMTAENWRPKTALAFGFKGWSRERPSTTLVLPESTKPQAGDIIVFDFSHVGIVFGASTTHVETIEGNTNGRGDRDSTSGDGVWRKSRRKSLAQYYVRIRPSGLK